MAKNKIDKEKLQRELDEIKQQYKHKPREMSAQIRQLLKKEIEESRKREKTRGAEMISIFAAHKPFKGQNQNQHGAFRHRGTA